MFVRLLIATLLGSALFVSPAAAGLVAGIDLGGASAYTVLGIGGTSSSQVDFEIYQSGTVVNGNVGVGPYSVWSHGMDATINGRVDDDPTVTAPTVTGTVTGGVHSLAMTSIVNDALNASNTAAGLAPTQTFSTLSEGQTIIGNGGLNVIRITDDVTLKTTLTLQGTASDKFVFQLTAADTPGHDTLTLSGVVMSLSGGVTADNILWDLNGTGGGISISSGGASVFGTFLAPDRDILVDNAAITGRVIGGGGTDSHNTGVSIHSTSTITYAGTPNNTVPEPASLAIWGLFGLAGITYGRRRKAA